MAESTIERLWVDRVPRFIASQRHGIDTWPGEKQGIAVTTLVKASIDVSDILDENGNNVGRNVEFYMNGKHMATFQYGKARLFATRQLVKTIYRV